MLKGNQVETKDSCGLIIFKWLVTIMSLVIAIPALFDEPSRIAFILTSCVFIFAKFVDNIEGISKYKTNFQAIICIIGSVVGAIAIGLCFYYFAAIFNETKFISSVNMQSNIETEMEQADAQIFPSMETNIGMASVFNQVSADKEDEAMSFDIDMSKYPLFSGEFFYNFLFGVLLFYLFEETLFGGCELCKYLNTKRKLMSKRKRIIKILNI